MNQMDLFSSLEPTTPGKEPEKKTASQSSAAEPRKQAAPPENKPAITIQQPVKAADHKKSPGAVPAATKTSGGKRGRKSLKELADDPDILQKIEAMPLEKQYYSIGEVSEMFQVNTSLIRYWENEFDILKPKKNRKGDRLFRQEDIHHLRLIYHLLRERKYTIEGARQKLKDEKKLAVRNFELVQSLSKVRKFLSELKEQL